MDSWLERTAFVLSGCLLAWQILLRFVPAHPIEGLTGSTLMLSAALTCSTGAAAMRKPIPRRIGIGISAILVAATFWFS